MVSSAGNVGIGTTSPYGKLNIIPPTANPALGVSITTSDFVESNTGTAFDLGLTAITGNVLGRIQVGINGDGAVGDLTIQPNGGKVGIGTTSPDGKLHVHTATAGSVTADANADDLVVENSGGGGLSILTPDASSSYIYFGSPTDATGSTINWNYNARALNIGTSAASGVVQFKSGNSVNAMKIDATGQVGIGITAPTEKLHMDSSGTYSFFIDKAAATVRATLAFGVAGTKNWHIGMPDSDSVGDGTEFFIGETQSGDNAAFWIEPTSGYVGISDPNPKEQFSVLGMFYTNAGGDSFWLGNGTGLPYGAMYQTDGSTFNVTMTTQNTWVELNAATTNINAGELNLCTFPDDHYVLAQKAGKYLINYHFTADIDSVAGGAQHIQAGIMLNGVIQLPGRTHWTFTATATESVFCGSAILTLRANEQASIGVVNTTSSSKILAVDHLNLNMTHIGG
jgi:hypothetical protein